jgi:hypothetical protein
MLNTSTSNTLPDQLFHRAHTLFSMIQSDFSFSPLIPKSELSAILNYKRSIMPSSFMVMNFCIPIGYGTSKNCLKKSEIDSIRMQVI